MREKKNTRNHERIKRSKNIKVKRWKKKPIKYAFVCVSATNWPPYICSFIRCAFFHSNGIFSCWDVFYFVNRASLRHKTSVVIASTKGNFSAKKKTTEPKTTTVFWGAKQGIKTKNTFKMWIDQSEARNKVVFIDSCTRCATNKNQAATTMTINKKKLLKRHPRCINHHY